VLAAVDVVRPDGEPEVDVARVLVLPADHLLDQLGLTFESAKKNS
jgi:hypothetical protein